MLNFLALVLLPDKRSDKHEVLDSGKIQRIVSEVKNIKGGIYSQAVFLLRRITTEHAFASGNKRTALLASIFFLKSNGTDVFIKNESHNARILLALRNVPDYYSDKELINWFKTGEIREYESPYPKPRNKSSN